VGQLFNVLTVDIPWTDWEIPWAGIGAVLAGLGSFLTGLAALRASRKQEAKDEVETNTRTPPND
jgi:hypothetical protein